MLPSELVLSLFVLAQMHMQPMHAKVEHAKECLERIVALHEQQQKAVDWLVLILCTTSWARWTRPRRWSAQRSRALNVCLLVCL